MAPNLGILEGLAKDLDVVAAKAVKEMLGLARTKVLASSSLQTNLLEPSEPEGRGKTE